ncbi:Bifunctional protein FolD [Buchnera aphidicola (Pterocallis alni)]|uniref:bifunctional methylenetetrahydrofolate dehydrogenase/methenyltetrahydrofolate cyclohydrolase FolD n=1 Tax=Buchnera aphidicola TaxID=9 RepID=UPI003464C025
MLSKIIDGKKIAKNIIHNIKNKVHNIIKKGHRPPGLAVIWVGKNKSSQLYIQKKQIACNKVGYIFKTWHFQEGTDIFKIIKLIKILNKDKNYDGILIQLPLPKYIEANQIIESIHPKKDVDGFHPYNIGCLVQKIPKLRPCTPKGIITLLEKYNINLKGLNTTVIGASNIVGRPMALELLLSGCTTTITHRFTKNLKEHIKKSDLIVIGIGKPNFLHQKNIKNGTIIIDVGINTLPNEKKIVGDVDFYSVYPKVSYITPVPGGVGPMTVASLLENTLEAYEKKHQYED